MKPEVVALMGKIECKLYPGALWNVISREQQKQVRKTALKSKHQVRHEID